MNKLFGSTFLVLYKLILSLNINPIFSYDSDNLSFATCISNSLTLPASYSDRFPLI